MRGNLTDLASFAAVAENRNFRSAASRRGVTPSALSHTIRQLEERFHDGPVDIVAKGFDAEIGTQALAASDMIAVRVAGPM